jgi:integrase
MTSPGTISKTCTCTDPNGKRLGGRCPQLRRATGAWSSSHGVWRLQLEVPTPAGTPRRQFRRAGFPSRDDAQDVLDEARTLLALAPRDRELTLRIAQLLLDLPAGQPLPTPATVVKRLRAGSISGVTTTVADYLDDWITERTDLSPGTINSYESHIRIHLTPHLGHLGIDTLRPVHIQDMFTAIEATNRELIAARASQNPDVRRSVRGKRIVGAATKQRIRATLRSALADAIKIHQLIETNPAVPINLASGARPRPRAWTAKAVAVWKTTGKTPSPVMVWMPDQASDFLDHAETHDTTLYAMYALITVWGLRRGEACGLRDIDIDLDTGVVTIVQQRTSVAYKIIVKEVKSDAGDRVLALDPHTIAILRTYLALRARWQLAAGPDWPHSEFFFVRPDGQPWHPDAVSDRFTRTAATASLPPIRFHDLRHCAASYLKLGGADMKTIQTILGHASIVITSDTYTLLFADLDRAATTAAANLIHTKRANRGNRKRAV